MSLAFKAAEILAWVYIASTNSRKKKGPLSSKAKEKKKIFLRILLIDWDNNIKTIINKESYSDKDDKNEKQI